MKTATVTATFEKASGENMLGSDRAIVLEASASTIRSAVSRALGNILKSPELKRKHIQHIDLSIDITKKEKE